MIPEIKGKCEYCGKEGKLRRFGVAYATKILCENEEYHAEALHDYYEEKRKADEIYYSNIPQYDDDDGWGY